MASNIKNLGLVLIFIGAILLILSYFLGWTNNNTVNASALVTMIVGLVVYIIGGKKALEKN